MKYVNFILYQSTQTVTLIETLLITHNQEHSTFLFQMDNFSAMQRIVSVSQRLVLGEENSPCPPFVEQFGVFCSSSHLQVVQTSWEKKVSIPALKTASTSIWIFFQWNSATCGSDTWYTLVSIFCAPHFRSTLLIGRKWKLRWLIVQKVLCLRQQRAWSCQNKFLRSYCHFLDEIAYNQKNWFSSNVKRPLNAVAGDSESDFALR